MGLPTSGRSNYKTSHWKSAIFPGAEFLWKNSERLVTRNIRILYLVGEIRIFETSPGWTIQKVSRDIPWLFDWITGWWEYQWVIYLFHTQVIPLVVQKSEIQLIWYFIPFFTRSFIHPKRWFWWPDVWSINSLIRPKVRQTLWCWVLSLVSSVAAKLGGSEWMEVVLNWVGPFKPTESWTWYFHFWREVKAC